MTVLVVGLSHRSAPVDVLERAAVAATDVPKLLSEMLRGEHVSEAMLVSTCNRVEVYAVVDAFHGGLADVSAVLARHTGMVLAELTEHVYVHYAGSAVQHLFAVAAGLDSMVVGEAQILGQLRDAYAAAAGAGTVGPRAARARPAGAARRQAGARRAPASTRRAPPSSPRPSPTPPLALGGLARAGGARRSSVRARWAGWPRRTCAAPGSPRSSCSTAPRRRAERLAEISAGQRHARPRRRARRRSPPRSPRPTCSWPAPARSARSWARAEAAAMAARTAARSPSATSACRATSTRDVAALPGRRV